MAVKRYRQIEPHLVDDVPLTVLARDGTTSERTLQRWLARYRVNGIGGLERSIRNDEGKLRCHDDLVELIRNIASKRPRPPVSAIYRKIKAIATSFQQSAPSYSAVARIVRAIPAARIAATSNPSAYRDQHELVYRREASAPNEMWQADHTVLDILVLARVGEPARPWLTVIVDDHSRAIAGYFLSLNAPSALNTALALRHAIWRKTNPTWIVTGVPEQLYVDNGSDFISEHIEQACMALKIRLIHSLPGRPRGRGKIERLFRTINDMFLPDLPGHLIKAKPLSPPAFTVDELAVRFEIFVCDVYQRRVHGTTGESPISRWQARGFLPAMPESLEQLDLLLVHVPKPRKVLRDGIRLMGRRYVEPTLAAFVGEQIDALYDPRDLTEIRVYHEGKFVCRALSPQHAANPSLAAIQQQRRRVRERDRGTAPTTMEACHGDQENPTTSPHTRRRLRLYAADD